MDVQEQCRYSEAFELCFEQYDYYLNTLGDPFDAFFKVKDTFEENIAALKKSNGRGYSTHSYIEGYYAGILRILMHLKLDSERVKR